jgi:antitoxin HigA-1
MSKLKPVTPGEILLEEFLKPMGLSQYRLAKEIGVPAQRIAEIVAGKRAITADTDLRLCRFFGLSNGYWLRAQVAHDTEVAERTIGPALTKIRPWSAHLPNKALQPTTLRGAAELSTGSQAPAWEPAIGNQQLPALGKCEQVRVHPPREHAARALRAGAGHALGTAWR